MNGLIGKPNREKLKAYDRDHYLANRERHNELLRAQYAANPAPKLAKQRAYR